MTQPSLNFTVTAPFAKGSHSSWIGAVRATQGRGEKVEALRQLFRNHGPMTLNEAAHLTGWPLSSICSLKSAIEDELEPCGYDLVSWGTGKATKRTQWRWRGTGIRKGEPGKAAAKTL